MRNMNFITVVTLISLVQGIFFSLVLFTIKGGNTRANRTLALLLLTTSLSFSYYAFDMILPVISMCTILFGPLLYRYVRILTQADYRFTSKSLPHLIAPGIMLTAALKYLFNPAEYSQAQWLNPFYVFQVIVTLFYVLSLIRSMKKYRISLKETHSSIGKESLSWISSLLWIFLLFFLINAPLHIITFYLGYYDFSMKVNETTPLIISFAILFTGFNGIHSYKVFSQNSLNQAPSQDKKNISERDINVLREFMEKETPFLINDLTLEVLSEKTGFHEYYLSRLINTKAEKNFFDFINTYRIEYFNKLILQPQNNRKKILDLALESGFYSKSTFNLRYKQYMGMTPSQFKKKMETEKLSAAVK